MSFDQDAMGKAAAKAVYYSKAAGPLGNGDALSPVRRTVFSEQIEMMMMMTQRLFALRHKMGKCADEMNGMRDEPTKQGRIESNPVTVSQAWTCLCEQVDDLEREVERLYLS